MGRLLSCLALASAALLAGCAASVRLSRAAPRRRPPGRASSAPVTVTLLAHDSFALTKTLLSDFEARTGITVKVVTGGDAGEVVNKAVLTAGNPEGDVLFGVDNTLLTRALKAGVFEDYVSPEDAKLRPELKDQTGGGLVTPIDYGDVCVDADDAWFAAHHLQVPKTLADLTNPAYKGLLVDGEPCDVLAGSGVPLRHHLEVRRARLADVLEGAQSQRRQGHERLGRRLQRRVLRRWQGFSAPRGVLRHRPRRGHHLCR